MPQHQDRIKIVADKIIDLKTIGAAIIGILVGAFFAGVYGSELKVRFDETYETVRRHTGEIVNIQTALAAQERSISGIGQWHGESTRGGQSGPGGGALNSPSECPKGQFVVAMESTSNAIGPCIGCINGFRVRCEPVK
jgi:hypothetical protein